ncbi:hypothetical protein [Winogradskyella sp.]|uniref:hypothetical protein n=1 Tax=Winogradskyella sp. TaxID=1883156 RepID=UPI0026152922|nr:hypothetical protein [uncultured Winogradskyella sp.]
MSLTKILFLPILFLLISCNQKQKQIDTWNERVAEFEETKNFESENKTQDFKKIVADFSEQYAPNRSEKLDSIPIGIIKAFKELRNIDKDAHEKYVTLIFTKLYAEHLRCCHQGYIIASRFKNDFDKGKVSMVNEFAFMSNYVDYENVPEAWSSGIIEKWLTENPRLLEFEPIGKHKQMIDSISNKIANGDYWNN